MDITNLSIVQLPLVTYQVKAFVKSLIITRASGEIGIHARLKIL
jgi:hypothetical protein